MMTLQEAIAEVRALKAERDAAIRLRDEAIEKYAAGADKRLADQDRAEAAEAEVKALFAALNRFATDFAAGRDLVAAYDQARAALTTKDTP
jgi:hypothetical protein